MIRNIKETMHNAWWIIKKDEPFARHRRVVDLLNRPDELVNSPAKEKFWKDCELMDTSSIRSINTKFFDFCYGLNGNVDHVVQG